jgi:hypothetical protein
VLTATSAKISTVGTDPGCVLVAYVDAHSAASYLATWNSITVAGDVTNLSASFLHSLTTGSAGPLVTTATCSNGADIGDVTITVTFTWDHPDRSIS